MSQQDFDPYYHWLGIPPHEQPPNHYRLLGISLFEADARVIGNAADQRMLLLRSFQTGPNAMLAQPLMSQVEIARATLLTPGERASYDRLLYSIQQQAAANQHAAYQHHYQPAPPAAVPAPHIAHQQAYVPATNAYYSTEPPPIAPPVAEPEPVFVQQPQPVASFYHEPPSSSATRRSASSKQKGSEVSVIVQTVVGGIAGLALAYGFITYILPSIRGQKPVAQKIIQAQPVKPAPPIPLASQSPASPKALPPSASQPIVPSGPPITPEILKPNTKLASSESPAKEPGPKTLPTEKMSLESDPSDGTLIPSEKPGELVNFPQFLKLPSTASIEEAVLFSHPQLSAGQLDFRLGAIAGEPQLSIKPSEPNTWALTAKPLDEVTPVELGQITVREDNASFAWKNLDRLPNLRSSLVNYFLLIDFQGKTHLAQFRKVATQPHLTLDLHKERVESESKIALPPPKETIFVRIKEVRCSLPTAFKDDKQEVPLGQDISICWPQTPGPEMRIRCVATDDSLKIITQNRFIEVNDDSAAGIPWTFEHLTKTINSMDAKRTKAVAEYNSILKQQIPAAIRAIQNVEGSSPQSQPEALQRAQLLTKLQGDLKRLRQRGSSLEKQVPELEARLAAAPTLNSFMQSIDGATSVSLEVFARNGDHEIVLLTLTSDASDKPATDTPAADTPAFTRP